MVLTLKRIFGLRHRSFKSMAAVLDFQAAAPRACNETRAQVKRKALNGMTGLAAFPRGGGIPGYGTARA